MAPHSSTLAWKIQWTEEPGRLQSIGSLRVRQDWTTSLSLFTFMHWRRKWQPTPVFLPGESQGQGSLVGCCLWGRTQSWTRLKRLSSSSSSRDVGLIPGSGRSPWGGCGNPLQCSCLENPMDRGASWATIHRVTKNQTQLKWLSMDTLSLKKEARVYNREKTISLTSGAGKTGQPLVKEWN